MFLPPKMISDCKGSAVLAGLGVLALVTFIGASGFTYIEAYRSHDTSNQLQVSRDLLKIKLENLAWSRDVLFGSILVPSNVVYRECAIDDSPVGGSSAPCVANTAMPVTLARVLPDNTLETLINGSGNTPTVYNIDGAPCVASRANGNCTRQVFRVTSEFLATCAGGAPSCLIVDALEFRFTITPSSDMSSLAPVVASRRVTVSSLFRSAIPLASLPPPPPPPPPPPEPPSGGDRGSEIGGGDGDGDDGEEIAGTPSLIPRNASSCPPGMVSFGGTCRRFSL